MSDGAVELSSRSVSADRPLPRRPADLDPLATLVDLIDTYQRRLVALTAVRLGNAAMTRDDIAGLALAALATAHAVIDDLFVERWTLVRDALASGASVVEVGSAMGGLEADEVAAGLSMHPSAASTRPPAVRI